MIKRMEGYWGKGDRHFMYEKLSNQMAQFLIRNGVGKSEYLEIYIYGFENVISTVINMMILFLIGWGLGLEKEILIYMIFFAILRNCAGGMHKNTHLSCVFTYAVIAFAHILILKGVFQSNCQLARGICVVYLLVAFVMIFRYAPMDSENKRLSEEEKKVEKMKSRKTLVIEVGSVFLMVLFQQEWLAIVATAAIMIQSVTLLPIINN